MRERATATLATIVVDDEQLAREELAYLLEQVGGVEVLAHFVSDLEILHQRHRLMVSQHVSERHERWSDHIGSASGRSHRRGVKRI